jgi:hypothetical protein
MKDITRRDFMQVATGTAIAGATPGCPSDSPQSQPTTTTATAAAASTQVTAPET